MTPAGAPARAVNLLAERYDVYCGRGRGGSPTKWGNPYRTGNRDRDIADFEAQMRRRIAAGELTARDFAELAGKRLGCFCKPRRCHADVVADAANNPEAYGL